MEPVLDSGVGSLGQWRRFLGPGIAGGFVRQELLIPTNGDQSPKRTGAKARGRHRTQATGVGTGRADDPGRRAGASKL